MLEQEPERLAEIRGVSPSRAREMSQSFCAQFGLREVVMTFGTYGLTANEALRCWKKFGPSTLTKIKGCISALKRPMLCA